MYIYSIFLNSGKTTYKDSYSFFLVENDWIGAGEVVLNFQILGLDFHQIRSQLITKLTEEFPSFSFVSITQWIGVVRS